MIKRIVIAGCSDYTNYGEAKKYIDFCISNIRKEICFWDGKSKGTKTMIEYAKQYGKPIRVKKI